MLNGEKSDRELGREIKKNKKQKKQKETFCWKNNTKILKWR